jgi:LysM repeat protein
VRSNNVLVLPVPGNRDLDGAVRRPVRQRPARPEPARRPVPAGRGRPRQRPGRLRLTRRGRLVLTILVMLLATGVGLLVSTSGGATPPPRVVRVQQGDTLWSIADRYGASRDPVTEIEQIRHLNHLSGSTIYPGQVLLVPVSS